MAEPRGTVSGSNDDHRITFYGLSTCIWCRKTRNLLEELDVAFDFIYVDLLKGEERDKTKETIREWNSAVSFPTIVIDNKTSVVGYKPEKIKEALGL